MFFFYSETSILTIEQTFNTAIGLQQARIALSSRTPTEKFNDCLRAGMDMQFFVDGM
jgi:hypothetical protein